MQYMQHPAIPIPRYRDQCHIHCLSLQQLKSLIT